MPTPDAARTRTILHKRVRRLLHLDRSDNYRSQLRSEVMPFLTSLGSIALIGGAVRDVARAGRRGFASDLDFVVYEGDHNQFMTSLESRRAKKNNFGGYALDFAPWKVDVWHIADTWAKTAGLVPVERPSDLLQCTFFDWDSAIYDINKSRLLLPEDYLFRLHIEVMDIRLEENPNPAGSLVRALRRAALWRVKFGPRLTAFSKRYLADAPWKDLVALDARAFKFPVLTHLDRSQLLERLHAPMRSSVGDATLPVPDWAAQLTLSF